ncbi:MAG: hypothetical protein ABSH08_09670 [Tepidisphaeraceae bacterium]|jgi:hypothetical protein
MPERNKCTIWEFADGTSDQFEGFLVTEVDNVNAPIAAVSLRDETPWPSKEAMLAAAKRIAADPGAQTFGDDTIDLRGIARLDSKQIVPGWLYNVACQRVGDVDGGWLFPSMMCRFRLSGMLIAYNRLKHPAECRELAYHAVSVVQHPDGTGENVTSVLAVLDRPVDEAEVVALIGDYEKSGDYNDRDIQERLAAGDGVMESPVFDLPSPRARA